jgi:hypothetical protein
MVESQDEAQQRAAALLKDDSVQQLLVEAFSYYSSELYDVLTLATIENAGVRPEGLANEVFSAFHHIVRGLCVAGTDVDKELRAARSSHLKRATLDSYKISINAFLREDNKAKELLDYMVLVEDFTRYVPDGLQKVNEIKDSSRKAKQLYKEAKRLESSAHFDESIEKYNETLETCYHLRTLIEVFTRDKSYILATAREAKKDQQRNSDRTFTMAMVMLTAILTASATYFIPKWLDDNDAQKVVETKNNG